MFKEKTITLIAAMARNRAIGFDGELPWHLPAELKHFKETTMGKPIVMGRKTWETIGRALPGRQNIVVTRNRAYLAEGCTVVQSFDEAMEAAVGEEVMIIGGGHLYRQALPMADRMMLTLVDCEPEADTWFPDWNKEEWQEISRRSQAADENNALAYKVLKLERSRPQDA
jgi:dihydrofolate reductase